MKILVFLVLLGIHGTAAVSHSLQYFYTASKGMERFPEFVAVGIVNGQQIDYYDSFTEENVLKQTWMEGVRDEKHITDIRRGHQQNFKSNVGVAMQRFNQTAGVHINQVMYGCEWDDETDKVVKGYEQHGYDGEDFLSLDLQTETWTAPNTQAVITKNKWDSNKAKMAQDKNYLTQICPESLKKYVNYGRSSLMRTERPSVSLLQKTPSSAVSCHATGFYPNRAELLWRRDGEEVHEGVDKGEVLPNNDGSFQMSADLDLSSVPTEDWMKYECVFQLSGAEDLATKLEKTKIRSNTGSNLIMIALIIVAAVVLVVIAVIGFILHKKKNAKRPPSPVENAEVQEQMMPKA